jgi:hypothetical protein
MDQERAIEFILDQQAKFAAGMVDLQARQDRFQTDLGDLRSIVARVVTIQERFASGLERLAEAQLRTEEAHRKTEEAQRKTAEAARQTEEKLNALIAIVDGMIRPPKQQ